MAVAAACQWDTMVGASLRMAKHALRQHMEPYMHLSLLQTVRDAAPDFFTSGEQQEGGNAFFEKRKPDFSKWR